MTASDDARTRERKRAYYLANKDRITACSKAWAAANPERTRELQRAHYAANREARIASATAWNREHQQERRAAGQAAHAARPLKERRGFVYVLTHPRHEGFVKIGRTGNISTRLTSHNTGCPDRAYVMAKVVPTDNVFGLERRTQSSLGVFHHGGEWFRCSVETAVAALEQAAGPSVFD